LKELLDLFRIFIVIGASTFGGGYSLLSVMERELIKKRDWINMDEVMDYFSLAQITPGVIAVNLATFVGYKRKGLIGGIIATMGFILPGLIIMILASIFLKNFASNKFVNYAFSGIRIAIGALILNTVIKLIKGNFKNIKTTLMLIIAFVLSAVFSISPMLIILGAGIAGFLLFPVWRKNSEKTGKP